MGENDESQGEKVVRMAEIPSYQVSGQQIHDD